MFGLPLIKFSVFAFVFATLAAAQQPASAAPASASGGAATICSLEDGRAVSVRYNAVSASKERVVNGKPFTPGGAPMTLFTETRLAFGTSVIPAGAYTLYPIPGRDHWTLAVNKNVAAGSAYDEKQDLARAAMETAQVAEPGNVLDLAFAHVGSRCTLRLYFGKTASFADFTEKP